MARFRIYARAESRDQLTQKARMLQSGLPHASRQFSTTTCRAGSFRKRSLRSNTTIARQDDKLATAW
jgi:hypothetical protein